MEIKIYNLVKKGKVIFSLNRGFCFHSHSTLCCLNEYWSGVGRRNTL